VAAGLAYMPDYQGQKNVLGYHMWAQFYLDGQWVDYDAALPELPGPPRRLALAVSSLDDESAADFSLALLDWLAELRVTVEPAPDGVHP
jgi:transglutaminase-like putative cysteine protease